MKAVIAGASGLIGNELVHLLLKQDSYKEVIILVRKKIDFTHPKLTQLVIDYDHPGADFQNLEADVCFCTLGTTMKKAGSKEAFLKVDYTYPLMLANHCKEKAFDQFHIVTAMGANETSSIFYNQVKGKIENDIQKLALNKLFIYRPSMLLGERSEFRMGEKIGQILMISLSFLFMGPLKKYQAIKGKTVAQSMINNSLKSNQKLNILESDQIQKTS